MLNITAFTFNPFSENTYVVSNEKGHCLIFDPGMYQASEQALFKSFIEREKLKPMALINTHCHIDHIFGNTWVAETYQLKLQTHLLEKEVLAMGKQSAALYGLHYHESVPAEIFISEQDKIRLDDDELEILFTPGHSPGSLSFYSAQSKFIISGDVLFKQSIGRSDLPGGNHHTLIESIQSQLMTLPENTVVYSGHGPSTTIGDEKMLNPFLR